MLTESKYASLCSGLQGLDECLCGIDSWVCGTEDGLGAGGPFADELGCGDLRP